MCLQTFSQVRRRLFHRFGSLEGLFLSLFMEKIEVTAYRFGSDQLFKCPRHRPEESYLLVLEPEKQSESHLKLMQFMSIIEPLVKLMKGLEGVGIPVMNGLSAVKALELTEAQSDPNSLCLCLIQCLL